MTLPPFGHTVRHLRVEHGLLLMEMAIALKLSTPQLSGIEVGRRPLTLEVGEQALEFFRPIATAEQLEELRDAVEQTLAMPHGGVQSDFLSQVCASPAELVAQFATRLQ